MTSTEERQFHRWILKIPLFILSIFKWLTKRYTEPVAMEYPAECFVSGCLATVLRMVRLVGAAPLRFQKEGIGWRVSLSPRLYKFCCFVVTFMNIFIMWLMFHQLKLGKSQEIATGRAAVLVRVILENLIMSIAVLGAPSKMRTMIAIVSQVQKINYELNIHWKPKQRKQTTFFKFWMLLTVALLSADYSEVVKFLDITQPWIIVSFSLSNVSTFFTQLEIMQFIQIVMLIRTSFRGVNDSLRSLLRCNMKSSKYQQERIRRISSAYVSACNTVRDVNRIYGLLMMLVVADSFFYLIVCPYFVIKYTFRYSSMGLISFIIYESLQFASCIFFFISLVTYIEPCHLTYKEMECTHQLVSQLMQRAHSVYSPIALELEQFCRQLTINKVSYKPLNAITLTRSLVIKILANITTYLVIMNEMK